MTSLKQNWFMDERFEMFKEDIGEQYFFDTITECIYVVSEDEHTNNIKIEQYEKDNYYYESLHETYIDWKKPTFEISINAQFEIKADNYEEAYKMVKRKLDKISADDFDIYS